MVKLATSGRIQVYPVSPGKGNAESDDLKGRTGQNRCGTRGTETPVRTLIPGGQAIRAPGGTQDPGVDGPADGAAKDPEYLRPVPVPQPAEQVPFLFRPVDPDGTGPGRRTPRAGRPGMPRPHDGLRRGIGAPPSPRPGARTAPERAGGGGHPQG